MCRGIKGKEKEDLFLEDIDYYNFLNTTGCTTIDTINDKENYESVSKGMQDIFGEEKFRLLEILSAILLFGNVIIEAVPANESSRVANPEIIGKIGSLLKIQPKVIENALIMFKSEHFVRIFNQEKALDARNACAKTLYGKLFDYIFTRINEKFKEAQSAKSGDKIIGLLDIYGFEILETNSFEQLCINYANEKLHQHFVNHTFKLEQAIYIEEGIDCSEIKFRDNEPIVQLIEHNIEGIFACIEDQIRVPKGSDEKLIAIMHSKYAAKKGLYSKELKNPKAFQIHHFTSPVSYKVTNFLEKAKDEISWNILEMLGDSNNPTLKKIFRASSQITSDEVKGAKKNIGIQYKEQIGNLMKTLEIGEPHYIKCILPNREKLPMCFDHNIIREQLHANGVLETLEIYQQGYPIRMAIEDFIKTYRLLCKKKKNEKIAIQDIFEKIKDEKSTFKLGKNYIFMKEGDIKLFDNLKKKAINDEMQKIIRCKFIKAYKCRFKGLLCKEVKEEVISL